MAHVWRPEDSSVQSGGSRMEALLCCQLLPCTLTCCVTSCAALFFLMLWFLHTWFANWAQEQYLKKGMLALKWEALGGLRPGSLFCCYLASSKTHIDLLFLSSWFNQARKQKVKCSEKTDPDTVCLLILSHWQSFHWKSSPTLGAGRMGRQWSGVQTALAQDLSWVQFPVLSEWAILSSRALMIKDAPSQTGC